jgi:predicted amidohydrolase YtcJ
MTAFTPHARETPAFCWPGRSGGIGSLACGLLAAVAVLSAGSSFSAEPATLVVIADDLITLDPQQPSAEGLAARGEEIVALGTAEEMRQLIGPDTQVIEAAGRVIVPGFNDAHIHPTPLYDEMSPWGTIDCSPAATPTIDALVARLREKAAITPRGQWVRGGSYQDTKLGRHPTRDDLDRVSTEHPVLIGHSSGHVAACNSLALEAAGIDADAADPKGGRFDRDADGRPNGVLRESAVGIVKGAGPERPTPDTATWIKALHRRFDDYLAAGITSIQHAGTSLATVERYRRAQAARRQVRIYAMLRSGEIDELEQIIADHGRGDDWLQLGGIKTFQGNSLSGQTCWLSKPYANRPDYFGIPPSRSLESLIDRISGIHEAGLQACIHANGDREIAMVLDAYEEVLARSPRPDHRHRIEHASVCPDELVARIKELGIVLAPHSYIWEHGDKMEAYGSWRWDFMHPNGSALAAGVVIAGNSDSPVSAAVPMLRIQSMVTRTSAEGKVYGASQRLSVLDAIRAWTLGSAYASHQDHRKGSLTPGKLADFVVLAADPRTTPPEALRHIDVELTIVGGEVVYRQEGSTLPAPAGRPLSPGAGAPAGR